MGQYQYIKTLENKILTAMRERVNEKKYRDFNRYYLFNSNENNSRYYDYVREFEEDRARIINEMIDSISDMKIKKAIEIIEVNNIENLGELKAGIDYDYKIYSLVLEANIKDDKGEIIECTTKIPYVSEKLFYNSNGETEVILAWI